MNEDMAAADHSEEEMGGNGEENPAAPPAENHQEEADPSHQGENNSGGEDDKVPFHQHPRWQQREEEWNARFNEQETRHQDELKQAVEGALSTIRQEFADRKREIAPSKPPAWFGGTQEQWDAYKADRDAELEITRKDAEEAVLKRLGKEVSDEEAAVAEATKWFNSEIASIKSDKTLNPSGADIDPAKLLKTAVDNQLIDTRGRWNYRAAFRIMRSEASPAPAPKPPVNPSKEQQKRDAAATSSESGKDNKPPTYATSKDFEKDRPW